MLVALVLAFQDPQETLPVSGSAVQQETLVTARRFEELLRNYPGSATVVDQREIEQARLETVRDASRRVPNLYMSEFSARRLSFPFVRGIGSGINEPAVITYIDDVPQFGFGGTNLPLFEVQSVEFLRGPQGTLYGRNALGGLLRVNTARPASTRELGASVSYGSFDELEASATYSGPIPGGLGRFGYVDSQRDGYTKNDFPDGNTGNLVDDRHGQFGRATAGSRSRSSRTTRSASPDCATTRTT